MPSLQSEKGVAAGAFLMMEALEPSPQQLLIIPGGDTSQGTDPGEE